MVDFFRDNGYALQQTYTFDFFNYAGIHRSVVLYTTPRIYISDVTTKITVTRPETTWRKRVSNKLTAIIDFAVDTAGYNLNDIEETSQTAPFCQVTLLDKVGNLVGYTYNFTADNSCKGQLILENATLWWPYLMDPNPGYMYTLEVKLIDLYSNNEVEPSPIDVYRLPIGIRTLRWTNTSFLINEKPVYLRGFGRHEDSAVNIFINILYNSDPTHKILVQF